MGTTTSRPIFHGVESFLINIAQLVDAAVRLIERLLSSLFTFCLPSTLFHDWRLEEGGGDTATLQDHKLCFNPAARIKQQAHFKQRYEDRLRRRKLRAEWAAAGLDVVEMERQEQAKKRKQQQKAALIRMDEKQKAKEMLGSVAKAPAARPELDRETISEKERGKLWIMGNVPSTHSSTNKTTEFRMPSQINKRGALESVRETSFYEAPAYTVQGHGGRIASSASEHGDISYQIVATSKDEADEYRSDKVVVLKPERRRKTVTSHGIMPSQAQPTASTASASRLDAVARSSLDSHPSRQAMKGVVTSPLKSSASSSLALVQPTAQRLRRSLDLVSMSNNVQEQANKIDPISLRGESPRFFDRARASLDIATSAASQQTSPSSPMSSPPALFSSASSDTASIASRRSIFGATAAAASISRGSTPPCVTDLADRACKSRWEANARERKVWKGELDRITLHKLQQTSKRHHQETCERKSSEWGLNSTMTANTSDASNLALIAEKRLRRASFEPQQSKKAVKLNRKSLHKSSHHKDNLKMERHIMTP